MDHASSSPCFSLQHFKPSKPISSFLKDNIIKFRSTYVSPRGNVARAFQEEDEYAMHKPPNSDKNRGRLIALLKRIQVSINQEESGSRDDKSYLLSDDDSFAQMSILEFLQSSIENVNSNLQRNEQSIRRTESDEEKSVSSSQQSPNAKAKRAPSHSFKKTPMAPPMPSSNNVFELNDGGVSSSNANIVAEQLEVMKLSDLKGLAKERGVRGYSKLNKSELIELLRFRDHS